MKKKPKKIWRKIRKEMKMKKELTTTPRKNPKSTTYLLPCTRTTILGIDLMG